MAEAVVTFNTLINEMLAGKLLSNMKAIDGLLASAVEENEERFGWKNVSHLASFALAKAAAQCEGEPYEGVFKRVRGKQATRPEDYCFPGLAITLLKGGKALNSKVKVSLFWLFG